MLAEANKTIDPPAFRRWKRTEGASLHEAGKVGDALRKLTAANRHFNDPDLADAIDQIEAFLAAAPERVRAFALLKPRAVA